MKYLVDTHALIWYLEGNQKLSYVSKLVIENKNNVCFVSIATIWEMAIKISLRRLDIAIDFYELKKTLYDIGIEILLIQFEHIQCLGGLPLIHTDPFNRILIAQSKVEDLIFITKDESMKSYQIQTLW